MSELGPAGVVVAVVVAAFVATWYLLRARPGPKGRSLYVSDGRRLPGLSAAYLRRRLEALRKTDPLFSTVLFEEFALALYSEAHLSRGDPRRLEQLSAFLRPAARKVLDGWAGPAPKTVLVGGVLVRAVEWEANRVRVVVEFDAAHTEATPDGEAIFYTTEAWTLVRDASTPSRPPERVQVFVCPHCGAALDRMAGAECGYCGTRVDTGGYDWVVEGIALLERDTEGPAPLFGRLTPGLATPSEAPVDVRRRFEQLCRRTPGLSWERFTERVRTLFTRLQEAWDQGDPTPIQPLVTDRLLNYELYWIARQAREGVRGAICDLELTWIDLIEVASDRFFDHVTVRIFCVQRRPGQPVEKARAHTEYWTLIRGRAGMQDGAAADPNAAADTACPSCGAPLTLARAGRCAHCGAHVARGAFDWLLSRIEQQEAYEAEVDPAA